MYKRLIYYKNVGPIHSKGLSFRILQRKHIKNIKEKNTSLESKTGS